MTQYAINNFDKDINEDNIEQMEEQFEAWLSTATPEEKQMESNPYNRLLECLCIG